MYDTLEEMGFKKEKSLGGYYRWYYSKLYFSSNYYSKTKFGTISGGTFGINEKDLPETFIELYNNLIKLHDDYGIHCGKQGLQFELRNLLGLEE